LELNLSLSVAAQAGGLGARLSGIDLSEPLEQSTVDEIRAQWLTHKVVYFHDQPLTHLALARFTQYFGDFGVDPYVESIAEHDHILEVRREASEQASPFGGSWHSDWSFQQCPPSATILHAKVVPPVGGNTHFADGAKAYRQLSPSQRLTIDGLEAIHSARRPYSHEGFLAGGGKKRSMKIRPNDDALETQYHPLVRTHPETQEKVLWVNPVYTIGIRGMPDQQANKLLQTLFKHLTLPECLYQHQWQANMLAMWDNRSVVHCAQGGYDGHQRIMHRTTVAGTAPN
jgi:taurine dioxygenase